VIFSNIFLPILYDIGLYIYTVKYKSGIKIPGFLRNISKTQKKIKNIRKKYFIAHGQILIFFSSIFFIKKTKIASFSCKKKSKK